MARTGPWRDLLYIMSTCWSTMAGSYLGREGENGKDQALEMFTSTSTRIILLLYMKRCANLLEPLVLVAVSFPTVCE